MNNCEGISRASVAKLLSGTGFDEIECLIAGQIVRAEGWDELPDPPEFTSSGKPLSVALDQYVSRT